jgi:hypothetical protein
VEDAVYNTLATLSVWGTNDTWVDRGPSEASSFELVEELLTARLDLRKDDQLRALSCVDSRKAFRIANRYLRRSRDAEDVFSRVGGLLAGYGDEDAKAYLSNGQLDTARQIAVWGMISPDECAALLEPCHLHQWERAGAMAALYKSKKPRLSQYIIEALPAYSVDYIEGSFTCLMMSGGGFRCIGPSQNDYDTFPDTSHRLVGVQSPLDDDEEIDCFQSLLSEQRWRDISERAFQSIERLVTDIGSPLEPEAKQILAMAGALSDHQTKFPDWLVAEISFSLFLSIKHFCAADTLLNRQGNVKCILAAYQHVNGDARRKIQQILAQRHDRLEVNSEVRKQWDETIREWILNSLKEGKLLRFGLGRLGVGLMPGLIQLAERCDRGDKDLREADLVRMIREAIRAERHYLTPAKVRELLDMSPTVQHGVIRGVARENCHWAAQIIAERWDEFDSRARSFASDALYELADPEVYTTMKENYPDNDRSRDRKALKRVKLAYERSNRGADPGQVSLFEAF